MRDLLERTRGRRALPKTREVPRSACRPQAGLIIKEIRRADRKSETVLLQLEEQSKEDLEDMLLQLDPDASGNLLICCWAERADVV